MIHEDKKINKKIEAQEFLLRILQNEVEAFSKTHKYNTVWSSKNSKFFINFIRKLGNKILPEIVRYSLKYAIYEKKKLKTMYINNQWDKSSSLDFIMYIIKNDPTFPLEYFIKDDWNTIYKFMRNKILLAFYDKIPKNILFSSEEIKAQNMIFKEFKNIKKIKNLYIYKGFKSVSDKIDIPIFFTKYGCNYIEAYIKEELTNKDIIDCGAYIGDSAYILNEVLSPKRIICIEPDEKNFNILKQNIILNNLQSKLIPLKLAVGEKECIAKLCFSNSPQAKISSKGEQIVNVTTIDKIVKDYKLNVGLIKMDIEGFEYYAILGSKKTIKKFKPTLIISLYHTGKDFFEIPYILKNLNPSYKFRFVHINPLSPACEYVLIAWDSKQTL